MTARPFALLLAAFLTAAGAATGAETRLAAADRTGLDITVYGNGLALIRDRRPVALEAGESRIAFDGISRRMIPSSALLSGAPGIRMLAMDHDADLLTPDALLRRALGRRVGVVRTHPTTGEESVEEAEVLSVEGGVVLRYRDRIESGIPGRLVFPDVPQDLRPIPALVATLEAERAGRGELTLTYLTDGLTWSADYAVVLDEAARTLDLDGRATIANTTGADYEDAAVSLVAGEVGRVSAPPQPVPAPRLAAVADAAEGFAGSPMPERAALGDLHRYRIERRLTLADRESKLLALVRAAGVPFERRYVSEASPVVVAAARGVPLPEHPEVRFRFENAADTGAGEPLPTGIARVYTRDADGVLRLLGEDRLERTPAGEVVVLTPGRAFDITVRRTQTDFVRSGLAKGSYESAHRIEVRNARDEAASVEVVEVFGGDWTIREESAPHRKEAGDRAVWTVDVAPGATAVVTYRVFVQR